MFAIFTKKLLRSVVTSYLFLTAPKKKSSPPPSIKHLRIITETVILISFQTMLTVYSHLKNPQNLINFFQVHMVVLASSPGLGHKKYGMPL